MSEKRKLVYLSPWKRVGVFFLELILILGLIGIFDAAFVDRSVKSIAHYDEMEKDYYSLYVQYQAIEDEYGLFVYESDSRIANEEVTKETLDAFYADSRVIRLADESEAEAQKMKVVQLSIVGASAFLGTLVGLPLFQVAFAGNSLSSLTFHFDLVDEEGKKVKWKKKLLYGFCCFVAYVVGSIVTLLTFPIMSLKRMWYDERHQTYLEKWMGLGHAVKEKYIGD